MTDKFTIKELEDITDIEELQHYHLEIDKQIAKKIRAGNIPTQYRGMTAKQIFAAMENES